MRRSFSFILMFICFSSLAQKADINFSKIDWAVQSVDAPTTDLLAKKLTAPYTTDLEKVRAIFSWIAQHIQYNMGIYSWKNGMRTKYVVDYSDTSAEWRSADEMVADRVLKRRVAVCDGYARLFKTLCGYAGIRSELVLGYVRAEAGKEHFRTNHTWNAVMIDSTWHLIDVTWGSGFVTYSNVFVQSLDEYYFLTPPEQMIRNHYPEDPKWTLLNDPPLMHEFKDAPFKCKAFIKYGISSFTPSKGVIDAFVGDTVKIEVQINAERAKTVASSNYDDSFATPFSYVMVEPAMQKGNKVVYTYVLDSPSKSWLQLVYNKDVILQYRINVKEKPNRDLSIR